MIVVAGPSGSGKSSNFPIQDMEVPFFSVDDWCARYEGSYQSISLKTRQLGSQKCEHFITEHIKKHESFAVETTLRGDHAIKQAEVAKLNGFKTIMIYISAESLDIAIERVRLRGISGGHSAPPHVIKSIYLNSHQNLKKAIKTFDLISIFTSIQEHKTDEERVTRLEAVFTQGQIISNNRGEWPNWLKQINP